MGMKRLAKVEREIEEKLKKQAQNYNKSYPGEMVHFDTKRLPLLQNQKATDSRDYLFVATAALIALNVLISITVWNIGVMRGIHAALPAYETVSGKNSLVLLAYKLTEKPSGLSVP